MANINATRVSECDERYQCTEKPWQNSDDPQECSCSHRCSATEQPSHRDQKLSRSRRRPGASSTHLNDLRLRVFRPERLGWGGHTHGYKAIWFSI